MKKINPICKIKSVVVHGNKLGRTVGMPTANFDAKTIKDKLPKNGVYGSIVILPDGSEKFGVTNIGTKPSVDKSGNSNIETHILDFDGNLYGKEIVINIIKFIRDIKKFNSLEEVKKQVDLDKTWIKSIK